jgi:hypothetical protein
MLSTTVEPECLQRPFVVSYAMIGPASDAVAVADGASAWEAREVLAHNTIHPPADRAEPYGATARANSPAVR